MNYTDKEFKDLYAEILEDVKTLTSHWDPEVSDEADPGVAILKSFSLFFDKLLYIINYKDSQNSVKKVTDLETARELFYELGYQMVGKKSASGEITARLPSSASDSITIPLFTQFTDLNGNINFTSIRQQVTVTPGNSKLIKVQEGIPVRYTYSDRKVFNRDDLSSNLRLSLQGYSRIAENGVVICSVSKFSEDTPVISDWLNTNENAFTSVETKNIYSVGYDSEGGSYIQFYEDSLNGLTSGIAIWILSSSGAGGNIPANKISRILDSIEGQDNLVFSHNEISNGTNEEDINSALKNYYSTFGVNNTLISERDYTATIENLLAPDLNKLVSKALVTGPDGNHNLVEILSELDSGARVVLIKQFTGALISTIFINALKPYLSGDLNYKEAFETSFESLVDSETENLIKKALSKDKVVSVDSKLLDDSTGVIYDKYLYDVVDLNGRIIIDSDEEVSSILEKVVKILCNNFNSSELTPGEEIDELKISEIVNSNLTGVVSSSFYLTNHRLAKKLVRNDGQTTEVAPTTSDKVDLVAREVLKGNIGLFEESSIQVPPGAVSLSGSGNPGSFPTEGESIVSIESSLTPRGIGQLWTSFTLGDDNFLQFYRKELLEEAIYGLNVTYNLKSLPVEVHTGETFTTDKEVKLLAGSVIGQDSYVYFTPDQALIDNNIVTLISSGSYAGSYRFEEDYTVVNLIEARAGSLFEESSILYKQQTLKDNVDYNLSAMDLVLELKNGSNPTETFTKWVRISGFGEEGLTSTNSSLSSSSPNLNSSQQITPLYVRTIELTQQYYYGLIIKGESIVLDSIHNKYLLSDGEHFIYSNSDLLDFVDFGSGTLLELPEGINSLTLSNKINLEKDNISAPGVLERLSNNLNITNTEIDTKMGSDFTITIMGWAAGSSYSSKEWTELSNSLYVKVEQDGTLVGQYGEGYFMRAGVLATTGKKGILEFDNSNSTQPIKQITLKDSAGNTQTYGENNSGFISFSSPLLLGTSGEIPKEANLTSSNFKLEFSNTQGWEITDSYDNLAGFSISFNTISTQTLSSACRMNLARKDYLLKLKIVSNYYFKFNLAVDSSSTAERTVKVLNTDINFTQQVESGTLYMVSDPIQGGPEQTFLLFIKGYDTLDFTFTETRSTPNISIVIDNFTLLEGYNPNLFYNEGSASENFLSSQSQALFDKIAEYCSETGIPFDYEFNSTSPLNTPTRAIQYYDPRHTMNRNVITKLDLDSDKLKKNLVIIRRNRW